MRLNFRLFNFGGLALMLILLAIGCAKDDGLDPLNNETLEERGTVFGKPNIKLVGLTPVNELVHLLSGPPVVEKDVIPIIGLRVEEYMLAIDFSATTKELFGITNQNILYKINVNTGLALAVSGIPINPAIEGETVGLDFDSKEEVLRLITSSGQNLRISPLTGKVIGVDQNLQPGSPAVQGSAYAIPTPANSKASLYNIDYTEQALFVQYPHNDGNMEKIGPLGFVFEGEGGFEIGYKNEAFAVQFGRSLFPGGAAGSSNHDDITQEAYRLLKINLEYGSAQSYGRVRPMIGLTSR